MEPLEDVTGWMAQAKQHAVHASHGAVQHELFLQRAQLDWLETHLSEAMPAHPGDDMFERFLELLRE